MESQNNPADIGTRKGASVQDVNDMSTWIRGLHWMSGSEDKFPIKNFEQVQLTQQNIIDAKKESMITKCFHANADKSATVSYNADQKIILRYVFSEYLLDPNKFRFRKVIRVFAIVLTFIWKISKNVSKVRQNRVFRHVPPNNLA